jgi:signal transduction histidine kinase
MKKFIVQIYLLSLLSLSQYYHVLAQQPDIQQLESLLPLLTDDSLKTATLVELCWAYRNIDVNKSEMYCQQAEKIAQQYQYTYLLAKTLNHLGLLNNNKAEYDKALVFYFQSLDIAEKYNHIDQQGYAYQSIAEIYRKNKQTLPKALEFIKKSLEIFEKEQNKNGLAFCYLILGRIYKEQQKYDLAIENYDMARNLWEKMNYDNPIANVDFEVGIIYKEQKNYKKATTYFARASRTFDKLNNIRGKILIINQLSNISLTNKELDSALIYVRDALQLAQKSGITELVADSYHLLVTIAITEKDFEKAYMYEKMLNNYKDSVISIEKNSKTIEIETKYDLAKKIQAIQYLQNQNKEKQNTLYLSWILLFAVSLIVFLLFVNIKQKQKINRQLIFQQEQISSQNNSLSQLNQEVSLQKEELEKLNNFKNKLFSIISHDLRNPFASLKGALLLFKGNFLSEEEKNVLVDKISNDLQASSYLLDNLLNWTKSQMQGLKINPIKLHLKELIQENITLLMPQAKQKEITISLDNSLEEVIIEADLEMTKSIIRNILHNSIKYSFVNSSINIHVYTQENQAVIAVKDTGRGMNTEEQQKLFGSEHFSKHGTANEKGSGLGLLMSKDFVEKNGGKIWVESKDSQGSTFSFSLPLWIDKSNDA